MSEPFANPRKTFAIKRLGAVDVSALREAMLAIPEPVWDAEDAAKMNRFEALGRTRHVIFRFVDNYLDWRVSHDRALWPEWRALLLPVLEQATRAYGYAQGSYPRVMFARMGPGEIISAHRDENHAAKWPHKIHIPLQTNDKVAFVIDGIRYHFAEGEAVEVNNMGMHAVYNEGDTDRVHLIFEYYDAAQPEPSWLESLLQKA